MTIEIRVTNFVDTIFQYRGYDENENVLFQNTFNDTSEGVCEFIGCVHALMYIKKHDIRADIYTKNKFIANAIETKTYNYKTRCEKSQNALRRAKLFLCDIKKTIIIYTK